jgi:hypothetical protein
MTKCENMKEFFRNFKGFPDVKAQRVIDLSEELECVDGVAQRGPDGCDS